MPSVPKARKPSWMTGGTHVDPSTVHKPDVQRNKVPKINGIDVYKTNRHKKVSEAHRTAHPYCAPCGRKGILRLGTLMDHVIPINRGGAMWDPANHETSCDECHNIKRQQESRGIILPYMSNDEGDLVPYKE